MLWRENQILPSNELAIEVELFSVVASVAILSTEDEPNVLFFWSSSSTIIDLEFPNAAI